MRGNTVVQNLKTIVKILLDAFLLQVIERSFSVPGGVMWYLSAMIWGGLIIYLCLLIKRKMFIGIIAPMIVVFIYGFMWWKWNTVSSVYENIVYTYGHIGLLRGMADMLMGCFAYEMTQCIKCKVDKKMNVWLTFFEVTGYLLTIILAFSGLLISAWDFLCIVLLFISVSISFSGKSALANVFQHEIFVDLGKFSLNIYVSHITLSIIIGSMITEQTTLYERYMWLFAYIIGTLICAYINRMIAMRIRNKLAF